MDRDVTIVQKDDTKKLYRVSEERGVFYVKRYVSGPLSGHYDTIGSATAFADAIDLIKSDAGNVDRVDMKAL